MLRIFKLTSILLFIILIKIDSSAQITGTVFRDFNGNGTKDANEPLIPGITVNAFSPTGPCGSAVTSGNTSPNYSISGCGTGQVRIEFVMPTTGTCVYDEIDYSAYSGPSYGSSVQFTTGNATNVNYAIHSPVDYRGNVTNPMVYVPVYLNGDPLGGGNASTDDWFLGFPYSNSGTTGASLKINGSIIGATWGVAYSRQASKVFTSAFMKRHSGLGSGGSGAIYIINPTTSTPSLFYDMDANGYRTRADASAPSYGPGSSFTLSGNNIATYQGSIDPLTGMPSGLGVIGSNVERGLPSDYFVPNNDPAAFDQVGKVSLGGLEISEDGQFLYVVNLYDRKLYRLQLNSATNPTGVTAVTSYTLPNPGCTNGILRPFALKYANGKVYVGAVCSGENGGTTANLQAYVYALEAPKATASFNATPVLTFPLNYTKGAAINWTFLPYGTSWNPWNKDSEASDGEGDNETYPTPWLTDIDFTERGDLTMAFSDRSGHQWGENNYKNLNGAYFFRYTAGGDIVIAGNNCSGFTMENNGNITSINGQIFSGSTLDEGPNGGEFYQGDNYTDAHLETGIGSIANLKGTNEVIVTIFDPLNLNEGGTKKLSNNNGTVISGTPYKLYGTGLPDYGKANGLGETEFFSLNPPIEIGNRVWLDNDSDGIQDADDPGISGVTVQLIKSGTVIATAITDAKGNYYFSNDPNGVDNDGDGIADNIYNITQLMPNMSYTVRIPNVQGGSKQTSLSTYILTDPNAGGGSPGTQADVRDSDGSLVANNADYVVLTTELPTNGANNHTFDFGFIDGPVCTLTSTCSSTNQTNCTPVNGTASVTASGGQGTITYLWSSGETTASISNKAAGTYTVTVTDNIVSGCTSVCSVTITNTTVPPTANAGADVTVTCTTPSTTLTALGGTSYLWSTGATTSSITVTPVMTTTYTVTVTAANGCTDTDDVIVTINKTAPSVSCSKVDNTNCSTPNGSATATATGVTYLWSNGGTTATITGLNGGTYTVTVTSTTNGCTATCSATVVNNTTNPTANCTPTANTSCITPNGQATVSTNASSPTYIWSTGATTATITGLNAGTYTVTVTNTVTSCTNTCSAIVTNTTTPPTVTCAKVDNTNCSTPNGSATATATGVTYLWSNGGTTATITGLNGGTYMVTVTSTTNGCTATCSATVVNNTTNPTANCTPTANTSCTAPNGQATVSTNASSPTYIWSTGATTATITGLNAGTYTVTVTNSVTSCTNTCSAIVTNTTTPPTVTCAKVDNTNCGTPNGSATATATGVTYLWSNGGTTATISNLSAATYTVTVTSTTTGCTNTCSVTVANSLTPPTVTCTPVQPTCASPNGGSVTASGSGGTGTLTYTWSNGSSGVTITGLSAGTYTVTVKDGNNCTSSCSSTLNAPTGCCEINDLGLIIGNCDNKGTLTNAADDEYTFTLNPTGSGLGTTYTVSGLPNSPQTGTYGSPSTFGPYPIIAGVLNITVTDNTTTGCTATGSITPPQSCSECNVLPPTIIVTDNICPSRTGTINIAQNCGSGTFIQYSTNNGLRYSTTPITILSRCVNSTDTTCKSVNSTVTTDPKKCTNQGSECSLIANATTNSCNNNGTDNEVTDDYFTIQINSTVTYGGSSNKYEVVIGADPNTGLGGNVLNSGGTTYGSPVTVGNTKIFKADGLTSYQLIIRDINNNNCFQTINIDPVATCPIAPPKSPCYPVPCVPIGVIKN